MPIRALLRFRNPDSTQDLNDRYRGLFNKGFFSGGTLTPVPGSLKVDVGPFATAGSDGMFVREDSETTRLDVQAGFKNYIVIRQSYVPNDVPIISIESLTEPEFLTDGDVGEQGPDNPSLIVFGVVNVPPAATAVTSTMIETTESDIVDPLGRLLLRGKLTSELDLPMGSLNGNRPGDTYLVVDGSDVDLFSWNGTDWINITNSDIIADDLETHRQNLNEDEKHLTDEQAEAAAGSSGVPSDSNRYVTEEDTRLLSEDEADAATGNAAISDLEDSLPSASNRFITSSKVMAAPTEYLATIVGPSLAIELPTATFGDIFVGNPSDAEAYTCTAQQWFNLFSEHPSSQEEFLNDEFQSVSITRVEVGPIGLGPSGTEIDPQTSLEVDSLGFFSSNVNSLYLILDNPVDSDVRIVYGKRTLLGNLLPHLLMDRGPRSGQIDNKLLKLLLSTPNATFVSSMFDGAADPGAVIAYNPVSNTFVLADPDGGLPPLGIRGNFNNIIMEGLYTATSNLYSKDFLYADKANPGDLTNTPNEWFIGQGISSTQILVNTRSIPQDPGEFIPPIAFPEVLFDPAVQPGQVVAWISGANRFELADSDLPARSPVGVRGNNNNVIQSGKYSAMVGSPFVSGTRYFTGGSITAGPAGTLVSVQNDWPVGIGIDATTLLVNMNRVPIPSKWPEEHDAPTGYHKFKYGAVATRNAIVSPTEGMIFVRTDTTPPRIEYWNGVAWGVGTSDRIDVPSGSKMLFVQNFVPTGWSFDGTKNDISITITATLANGGTESGSWTVSGLTVDGHSLTVAEMPPHTHNVTTHSSPGAGGVPLQGVFSPAGSQATSSTGSGAAHSHGMTSAGTWRPYNVATILCTRN